MEVDLSPEQLALAEASQKLLTREWSTARARAVAGPEGSGHSPELWERIANAGWLSLAFPESVGGDGASLVDLGVIVREAGRALVPTTFLSTLHAGLLLLELGNEDQVERWLRPVLEGKMVASVGYAEEAAVHDPSLFQTCARRSAEGWRLSGRKLYVENGSVSDLIVVAARVVAEPGPGGFGLCLVPGQSPGVELRNQATFGHDLQNEVRLTDVALDASAFLGFGSEAVRARWDRVTDIMAALLSIEMVGGTRSVIDRTVEYVSDRRAFGRPIGSFQAVQHHMANAAMAVKGADLAAWQALWRLSQGLPAAREVAIAKASAGRAYRDTTVIAHQVWGGNGYSEESDLHLWSRRAVAADLRYGATGYQLQQLADQLQH